MFYFTAFIKNIPQNNWRTTALKKSLMVPKDKFNQTQYFAKSFPSPLALMPRIHFSLNLKKSSENVLEKIIAFKIATFTAPKNAPNTALETAISQKA